MSGYATETDVLIVGYGPVGEVLSILLAQQGHTVTVVERWPTPYPMPRAVAYDGEGARILAAAGVADDLADVRELTRDYTWHNADGETLMRLEPPATSRMGWPEATSMYQPGLERALAERGEQLPNLSVLRPYEAGGLEHGDDGVTVTVRSPEGQERVISAGWVVGCDGANSFVREHLGTTMTDFGFSTDWLICDVVLNEPREFDPNNLQICDPERPRTAVSAGPGHRRWEFMRVPGETLEELDQPETLWRLLGLFDLTPDNAVVDRHAVYTTDARCARKWRSGRLLIAGDAAHVMPPFIGQGMCSGLRDAANLAWKLGLVVSGMAQESVLDSYTIERRAHVRAAIEASIALGKILCETDSAAAAGRDAYLLDGQRRGRPVQGPHQGLADSLRDGFLYRNDRGVIVAPAGELVPQGTVARGPSSGLFDTVVGTGFVLVTSVDPDDLLDSEDTATLAELGAHVVRVLPAGTPPEQAGPRDVVDVDDVYLPYLAETAALGALVRPDFYLFGSAGDAAGVAGVVRDLRRRLAPPVPAR
ncbi:bifunctional 3-(3-hydroxy-phenyl)propionate/3-hydroxycinnamic acid hydroxylase [Saccharomonospora piscinae]|uniref:bifunctional 3-(3-hydroxy-phenyl)propionate/3-hydroxycinnamic acid hydroxylase MhpA n=1 Tax=Saccharomonospora piscinae TaxID=687388 RepID=UPI001105CC71|nr:bifunctional 3-(3-hydroxy-phenyl)propionate/3-hydroxycinnamic acid hydroxylase [Saccharomonospora piscinae]TLW91354.1 bifunctional 3-(3-hydroxy-phenyl)propionate/3-hydroxycinnamic acid hydroxylase [Saccharomonospora piscinae]